MRARQYTQGKHYSIRMLAGAWHQRRGCVNEDMLAGDKHLNEAPRQLDHRLSRQLQKKMAKLVFQHSQPSHWPVATCITSWLCWQALCAVAPPSSLPSPPSQPPTWCWEAACQHLKQKRQWCHHYIIITSQLHCHTTFGLELVTDVNRWSSEIASKGIRPDTSESNDSRQVVRSHGLQ